jgi:hypothetical protein
MGRSWENPNDFSAELKPCRHMRHWVSALADGSLRGFARWYTNLHAAGCPKCREALEALRLLRDRLRSAVISGSAPATLSPERWASLDAALDRVDAGLVPKATES